MQKKTNHENRLLRIYKTVLKSSKGSLQNIETTNLYDRELDNNILNVMINNKLTLISISQSDLLSTEDYFENTVLENIRQTLMN